MLDPPPNQPRFEIDMREEARIARGVGDKLATQAGNVINAEAPQTLVMALEVSVTVRQDVGVQGRRERHLRIWVEPQLRRKIDNRTAVRKTVRRGHLD